MKLLDFLVPKKKQKRIFYAILDESQCQKAFWMMGCWVSVWHKPDKLEPFCYQIKIDQQLDFEDLSDLPDMEELSHDARWIYQNLGKKTISDKTKGMRKLFTIWNKKEVAVTIKNKDPTSEAPVSQYIYYICVFSNQQAVAFSKMVSFQWIPLNLKWGSDYYLTVLDPDTEDNQLNIRLGHWPSFGSMEDDSEVTRAFCGTARPYWWCLVRLRIEESC